MKDRGIEVLRGSKFPRQQGVRWGIQKVELLQLIDFMLSLMFPHSARENPTWAPGSLLGIARSNKRWLVMISKQYLHGPHRTIFTSLIMAPRIGSSPQSPGSFPRYVLFSTRFPFCYCCVCL